MKLSNSPVHSETIERLNEQFCPREKVLDDEKEKEETRKTSRVGMESYRVSLKP